MDAYFCFSSGWVESETFEKWFSSGLGNIGHNVSFPHQLPMIDGGNTELQALRILLSMHAAVVDLDLAFCNATTVVQEASCYFNALQLLPFPAALPALDRQTHAQCTWMVMWYAYMLRLFLRRLFNSRLGGDLWKWM